jgi:hypothetical protein
MSKASPLFTAVRISARRDSAALLVGRVWVFAVGRPATHQRACQLDRVLPFTSRSAQTRTSNEVCRASSALPVPSKAALMWLGLE